MGILNTFRFIAQHPLTRHSRRAALIRWLRWQLGSRLLPGPIIIPYVNDARLIVSPGLRGSTGSLYTGLHEFEDMAFVLHVLRPDDVFVDVGANVGSYTVLGAAVVGARCISIEPIPSTFSWLRQNIAINGVGDRVQTLNIGLGRRDGILRFTSDLDTVNHVVTEGESVGETLDVQVRTLDAVLNSRTPVVIKIDVEGFETEVITGAARALAAPTLLAVIMELNGSGRRYGVDEVALHRTMLAKGFESFRYCPFERTLERLGDERVSGDNRLYIRNIEKVAERVKTAPLVRVLGRDL